MVDLLKTVWKLLYWVWKIIFIFLDCKQRLFYIWIYSTRRVLSISSDPYQASFTVHSALQCGCNCRLSPMCTHTTWRRLTGSSRQTMTLTLSSRISGSKLVIIEICWQKLARQLVSKHPPVQIKLWSYNSWILGGDSSCSQDICAKVLTTTKTTPPRSIKHHVYTTM